MKAVETPNSLSIDARVMREILQRIEAASAMARSCALTRLRSKSLTHQGAP
ncbi:hypothetical protein [Sinorhizobium meliloti]|uniref:hypothetical protein n=1 Tax=Rhizobium meliloti TaxID=382 RepID=UPI0013E31874|nr:hypothetical protein [Sinorhizobium meliloti]